MEVLVARGSVYAIRVSQTPILRLPRARRLRRHQLRHQHTEFITDLEAALAMPMVRPSRPAIAMGWFSPWVLVTTRFATPLGHGVVQFTLITMAMAMLEARLLLEIVAAQVAIMRHWIRLLLAALLNTRTDTAHSVMLAHHRDKGPFHLLPKLQKRMNVPSVIESCRPALY
jgi:hypothetical protein